MTSPPMATKGKEVGVRLGVEEAELHLERGEPGQRAVEVGRRHLSRAQSPISVTARWC